MIHRPVRHRYRAWDGIQPRAAVHPDDLLEQLGDRFLSDSTDRVLNDILHRGLDCGDGLRLAGLDDLQTAIRQELRDTDLQQVDQATKFDLSDQAGRLLAAMMTAPEQAGRLVAGASPGLQHELAAVRRSGGPLQAGGPLSRLLDLAELDGEIRQTRSIADVHRIPADKIAAILGEDLSASFLALVSSLTRFHDQGYLDVTRRGLSPQALRQLGLSLLQGTLLEIKSRLAGEHATRNSGQGSERSGSTRSYQFGDPFDLDLPGTLLRAVRRTSGAPVRLRSDDITIFEREETGRVAMLLAIDRSRSMGEHGYLLAAKRLALSLSALIFTRYPRDQLDFLAFSRESEPVTGSELAGLDWERYAVGTNIHDVLVAGRRKLASASGMQRTLMLITDGEPTAYRDRAGTVRYSEPPTQEALATTYAAARQLRRNQILLVVALLSKDRQTLTFANKLTSEAAGQLIVAGPEDLSMSTLMGYRSLRRA